MRGTLASLPKPEGEDKKGAKEKKRKKHEPGAVTPFAPVTAVKIPCPETEVMVPRARREATNEDENIVKEQKVVR